MIHSLSYRRGQGMYSFGRSFPAHLVAYMCQLFSLMEGSHLLRRNLYVMKTIADVASPQP